MGLVLKATITLVRKVGKVLLSGQMAVSMLENSKIITFMGKEYTDGKMEEITQDLGLIIK